MKHGSVLNARETTALLNILQFWKYKSVASVGFGVSAAACRSYMLYKMLFYHQVLFSITA